MDEALDKFRIYKTEVELQQNDLIKTLRTDRGGEYYDPVFFQSVGIIHETTAPYTPQQNGVAERKNRALKEMVNSMLSYSGLSEGFWGEAMLTACYLLNRVPNKRNKTTPYELWYKKRPNLSFLRVWGCRAVVRLPDPKRKTLGEKGIDCIFVGYAEHSKAYRFYVIEPNDSVSINSIIESRDAIFDENRFSSIPRPKDIIPNSVESQRDDHSDDVPSETPEPRKGKRVRKAKSYGSDFQLYLVEGSRDQVGSQYSYCYSIEEDPRTYNEAMQSRDAAFWKEAIDDEIGSIMENNTWVLSDLPPGCKPLGCKWIFKRKMKVDGTIDKFKARLVIQGFRQKEGIDYFDTYAPVARITTIRLLLALAAIHNLVIHQMDVKTTFLNGDLDEEVYMKQPEGFVMPGNEHKVCKLVKSYTAETSNLSSGIKICEVYNFVYMLTNIEDFGTDQNQVDKTKKFLSSKFSMKDMGEADVILGIKIKSENKGIVITQTLYIEKILKKFNREDCSQVSTPMDPVEKLMPNTVGRLSRFTSNPSRQHWHVITRVFKYLKGTMNYGLSYVGYPSVSEALSAAGKEAEWLRILISYSQICNGKSRHLGVRHSMIRELITNGVISIEFVRSQHNLADHLTKRCSALCGSRGKPLAWVWGTTPSGVQGTPRPNGIFGAPRLLSRFPKLVTVGFNSVDPTDVLWRQTADSNNTGGSGSANTGGTVAPDVHGCSYKTFTNGKPHTFNGTEGVVGLKRWFEKMEQVFEICKCAEDDKVKFVVCTFEIGSKTAPATEIQRMEQELWTLTLKGDDIEAYNNRFHELVLMCPELVSTEKKKIEKYIRGFPEGIKGNVTSSKPATLHDAINMARELIEQGVQAKALRIGDSNKRKWEDQQGNNYHQQQNQRQEAAKVYVAAPAKGRGYAGNLPWCNRCKAHHQPGLCPPRCGKCHKLGHQEGDCRTRIPVARDNSLQNVTCFGCGNHGHYRSDCPELKNRN
ncbi:zinc finger, CCHC-type containing protein [Tanacetum coccineum]